MSGENEEIKDPVTCWRESVLSASSYNDELVKMRYLRGVVNFDSYSQSYQMINSYYLPKDRFNVLTPQEAQKARSEYLDFVKKQRDHSFLQADIWMARNEKSDITAYPAPILMRSYTTYGEDAQYLFPPTPDEATGPRNKQLGVGAIFGVGSGGTTVIPAPGSRSMSTPIIMPTITRQPDLIIENPAKSLMFTSPHQNLPAAQTDTGPKKCKFCSEFKIPWKAPELKQETVEEDGEVISLELPRIDVQWEKTGEFETDMIECDRCHQVYHPITCLRMAPSLVNRVKENKMGRYMDHTGRVRTRKPRPWHCADCKTCQKCQKSVPEDQLMMCDMCDTGVHTFCLHPPLTQPPEGKFLCNSCVRCIKCNQKTPGKNPTDKWHFHYSMCESCFRFSKMKQSCPICSFKWYNDHEEEDMIQCDECQLWIHCECIGMTKNELTQFTENKSSKFLCIRCKEGEEAEKRLIEQVTGNTELMEKRRKKELQRAENAKKKDEDEKRRKELDEERERVRTEKGLGMRGKALNSNTSPSDNKDNLNINKDPTPPNNEKLASPSNNIILVNKNKNVDKPVTPNTENTKSNRSSKKDSPNKNDNPIDSNSSNSSNKQNIEKSNESKSVKSTSSKNLRRKSESFAEEAKTPKVKLTVKPPEPSSTSAINKLLSFGKKATSFVSPNNNNSNSNNNNGSSGNNVVNNVVEVHMSVDEEDNNTNNDNSNNNSNNSNNGNDSGASRRKQSIPIRAERSSDSLTPPKRRKIDSNPNLSAPNVPDPINNSNSSNPKPSNQRIVVRFTRPTETNNNNAVESVSLTPPSNANADSNNTTNNTAPASKRKRTR